MVFKRYLYTMIDWDNFILWNAECSVFLSGDTEVVYRKKLHIELAHSHFCTDVSYFCRCPLLEILSLKRSSMAHAVLNCPLLRDLDIASCHKFSDAAIRSAATSCPLLESLDMSNCSCVTDETIREIALTCGNLHVLNASYCPNISLEVSVTNFYASFKLTRFLSFLEVCKTANVDSSQASQLWGHYFSFNDSNIS